MGSAVVLGGGIAGLAAGLSLSQAGWRTWVVERASQLEAAGAALSLWPNAVAGLARLGVLDEVKRRGMPFRTMLVADRRERPILPARRVDGEALMVTRSDLQEALTKALPDGVLMLGRTVDRVDIEGGVSLQFADGATKTADIVVDGGGLRSVAADASGVSCGG
ncbi:FAD-dependent oxidoreductase [Sphingomonas bacterium]|uniref:FAD-dependent oxidoreductase n=1 Tax=Sphingomonas bacterium TaxID=1895847 RepID=UPI0015757522|nr:FAD-dependent monooxygenase [Sphingomonas bacterium]